MDGIAKISNNLTSFGAVYFKDKNFQTSIIRIRDKFGCSMLGMGKVEQLANLAPEDEYISISNGDTVADARNKMSLLSLCALHNAKLVLKT
ncbi:MAG: hypothetical protein K5622_01325, partial [Endomicrobiaceae bacterium]|nr:hypothetical protein [Endomicrobiaceae bacterium]